MLSKLKLGTKIGLGFAIVILLAAVLGGVAVQRMRAAAGASTDLANRKVPMVKGADQVESEVQETMYNVRGYALTGDDKFLPLIREHFKAVNDALAQCKDLAQKESIEELAKAAKTAQDNVDTYGKLFEETLKWDNQMDEVNKKLDSASEQFMKVCYEYLEDQTAKLKKDIAAGATAEKLTERFGKTVLINDVIDLGNWCRTANNKAQVKHDLQLIAAAMPNFEKIDQKLDEIKKMTTQEQNLKEIEICRGASHDYKRELSELINVWKQQEEIDAKRSQAAKNVLEETKKTSLAGIEATQASSTAAMKSLTLASTTVLVGMGVMIVLGILVAFGITRMITKSINNIIDRIKDIAQGEGDLTKRIDVTSQDEVGELATWFNTFVQKVHDIIGEVSQATREVAIASTQIAASSEEIASGLGQQAGQVTQISAAIEEMSSSIVEVAKKSGDAASKAGDAGKTAGEGSLVVTQTIDGMNAIRQAVDAGAASVTELGKRSEQIGAIINVINDIADQTNLLALNAAIEAARAGEHGRGFAVVADEVRKLADRTTKATEEISNSIKAIQVETGQAVTKMNGGTEQVKTGVQRATEAGASLEQIVASSKDVADMIRSIAAAAEEQSAASEQVAKNVESITAFSKQSTEGASQAAAAATQLSGKAEQLQRIVGKFKIAQQTTDTAEPYKAAA